MINEELQDDFFDDMLDETIEMPQAEIKEEEPKQATTLFDYFAEDEVENDIEEIDEKHIQSVENERINLRISLAQYARLWSRELTISTTSNNTHSPKYFTDRNTPEAMFAKIYLENIPRLSSISKDLELFGEWYLGHDDSIKNNYSPEIVSKLSTFYQIRQDLSKHGVEIYSQMYHVYFEELKRQLVEEQKMKEKESASKDLVLLGWQEYENDNIFIAQTVRSPEEELNMEKSFGIPITLIRNGDLVTVLDGSTFYENFCEPIKIATDINNQMIFKCKCGRYTKATEAIEYIEDKSGSYQRVRPIKCECGQHMLLNQVLLIKFAEKLHREKTGTKNTSTTRSIHTIGLTSLIGIAIEEEENPTSSQVRKILGTISTDMIPNIETKSDSVEDKKELRTSYIEMIKAKAVRNSITAEEESVLISYILANNGIDVSLEEMTNYVYSNLDGQLFSELAEYNRARATVENTNEFKKVYLRKSENVMYQKEMLSTKVMTKTFLTKSVPVPPEMKFENAEGLPEMIKAVINGTTISKYRDFCSGSFDSSSAFHSGVAVMIEDLLDKHQLREQLLDVLFSSFIAEIVRLGTKNPLIKMPQPCKITSNNVTDLRKWKSKEGAISPFNLYTVLGRSGSESLYAAYKMYKDNSAKFYVNYKPIDTLRLVNGCQTYLSTLYYISNKDDVTRIFFGIDDGKNPWEASMQKALFLETLIEAFPAEKWNDTFLYDAIDIYLSAYKESL